MADDISTSTDLPIKAVDNRNPDGTFGPNNNANPAGRPKGKSLKEFARELFMNMSDFEKMEYLGKLPKDIAWRMAEGNPAQDVTSGGEKINPIPIYGGNSIPGHNSDQKDI